MDFWNHAVLVMKQRKSPSLEGLISRLHVDMQSDGTMANVLTWPMQYTCRCHVFIGMYQLVCCHLPGFSSCPQSCVPLSPQAGTKANSQCRDPCPELPIQPNS